LEGITTGFTASLKVRARAFPGNLLGKQGTMGVGARGIVWLKSGFWINNPGIDE
jgi:hypothetical protein